MKLDAGKRPSPKVRPRPCERAASAAVTSRDDHSDVAEPRGWQPPDERRRNASNPTIGSRAQQTCKSFSGTNRRGREKRRGRHARHAAAGLHKVATPSAKRTLGDDVDEGERSESSDESQERQSARADWGRWTEEMETSPRSREERSPRGPGFRERHRKVSARKTVIAGKPRRSRRATGKDGREAGKANDPLPGDHLVTSIIRTGWSCTTDPEEPAKRSRTAVRSCSPSTPKPL